MKKTPSAHYRIAIRQGKDWMSHSRDPMHDQVHAGNVEKKAIEVYRELVSSHYPGIRAINPELARIAAWWHDCYKAQMGSYGFYANIYEGRESAKIIRVQLKNLLSREELELLADAVHYHSGSAQLWYLFFNRARSPLHRILLEADAYDILGTDNLRERFRHVFGLPSKLEYLILQIIIPMMLPLYLKTKTARKDLFKRIFTFWKAWFGPSPFVLEYLRKRTPEHKKRHFSLVIISWDDCMALTYPALISVYRTILRKFGIRAHSDEIISKALNDFHSSHIAFGIHDTETFRDQLETSIQKQAWNILLLPLVRKTVLSLANRCPVAIVTDTSESLVNSCLKRYGLTRSISDVRAGIRQSGRPNPVTTLIKHFHRKPSDVLLVCNHPHDIRIGRNAGTAVAYFLPQENEPYLPYIGQRSDTEDFTLRQFSDLLDIVDG
ncbi:MAG: HAD hydrolase-like protein [Candidatus Dojkabacteria bacterium]|nr:HAD hydrolase-like protein [Candidatus Dojkabacteria bacterium]